MPAGVITSMEDFQHWTLVLLSHKSGLVDLGAGSKLISTYVDLDILERLQSLTRNIGFWFGESFLLLEFVSPPPPPTSS